MRMSSSVRGSGQGSVEATVVLQCAEDGESTLSIRVGQPDMVSGARGKSCSGAVRTLASLHAASVYVIRPTAQGSPVKLRQW